MRTTSTTDRIAMVIESVAYRQKFGQPKHATDEVQPYTNLVRRAPRHRLDAPGPRHRLWDINQY